MPDQRPKLEHELAEQGAGTGRKVWSWGRFLLWLVVAWLVTAFVVVPVTGVTPSENLSLSLWSIIILWVLGYQLHHRFRPVERHVEPALETGSIDTGDGSRWKRLVLWFVGAWLSSGLFANGQPASAKAEYILIVGIAGFTVHSVIVALREE